MTEERVPGEPLVLSEALAHRLLARAVELDVVERIVGWQPTPERRALFALLYGAAVEPSAAGSATPNAHEPPPATTEVPTPVSVFWTIGQSPFDAFEYSTPASSTPRKRALDGIDPFGVGVPATSFTTGDGSPNCAGYVET